MFDIWFTLKSPFKIKSRIQVENSKLSKNKVFQIYNIYLIDIPYVADQQYHKIEISLSMQYEPKHLYCIF